MGPRSRSTSPVWSTTGSPMISSAIDHIRARIGELARPAMAPFDRIEERPPLVDPEEILGLMPVDRSRPYSTHDLLGRILDGSEFTEYKATYGRTMICGTGRIGGWAVGIVANDRQIVHRRRGLETGEREMQIGGVIYSDAADKGARFVELMNQKGIPLVFLQDVTGFMVGSKSEREGIIKDGAKLVNVVANSVVPKITIFVGNSFGAGNYALCGRAYGARFYYAWPSASISVMGGQQASKTLLAIQLKNRGRRRLRRGEGEAAWPRSRRATTRPMIRAMPRPGCGSMRSSIRDAPVRSSSEASQPRPTNPRSLPSRSGCCRPDEGTSAGPTRNGCDVFGRLRAFAPSCVATGDVFRLYAVTTFASGLTTRSLISVRHPRHDGCAFPGVLPAIVRGCFRGGLRWQVGEDQRVATKFGEEFDPVHQVAVTTEPRGHPGARIDERAIHHRDLRIEQGRVGAKRLDGAVAGEDHGGSGFVAGAESPPERRGVVTNRECPWPNHPRQARWWFRARRSPSPRRDRRDGAPHPDRARSRARRGARPGVRPGPRPGSDGPGVAGCAPTTRR